MKLLSIHLFFLLMIKTQDVFSAACCGGASSSLSPILGDEKAKVSLSYSESKTKVENVDSSGFWYKSNLKTKNKILNSEISHVIFDRFQGNFGISYLTRSQNDLVFDGISDLKIGMAYEVLTDWEYHPIRPKLYIGLTYSHPTQVSRFESKFGGLDSLGNGFSTLGFFAIATKTFNDFDFFSNVNLNRGFSKNVVSDLSDLQTKLDPGFGGNFGFGIGYNTKIFRFGTSLDFYWQEALKVSGSKTNSAERYANSSFVISATPTENFLISLQYTDQTFFGSPRNTSLSQTYALKLEKKFNR